MVRFKGAIKQNVQSLFGVVFSLTQVLLLVLIGRIEGVGVLGEYSLIVSVAVPFNVLGAFGFKQYLASSKLDYISFTKSLFLRFNLHFTLLIIGMFFILFYFDVEWYFALSLFVFKFLESQYEIQIGTFQSSNNIQGLVNLYKVRVAVMLAIIFLYIIFQIDLADVFLVGSILTFLHLISFKSSFLFNASKESVYEVFSRCFKIVSILVMTALLANIPRYYLGYNSPYEQLGTFSAMIQPLMLANMIVINAVNFSWGSVKKAHEKSVHEFRDSLKKILLTLCLFSFVFFIVSSHSLWVVELVFSVEMSEYYYSWLILCAAFVFNFFSHITNAANIICHREWCVAKYSFFILIASFGGILIPHDLNMIDFASYLVFIVFFLKFLTGVLILREGINDKS